jgi:sugar phosphate isomerase/epimerase
MRLTIQLYTVRDALAADLAGTLAKIKAIGLEYVELAGDYGKSGEEWKTMLDELGLKASGAHIGVDQFENNYDATVAFAKALGLSLVIVPWIGKDRYENGWAAFGAQLEVIAQKLAPEGIKLAYHNHDFEYADGDGFSELYAAAPTLNAEVDAAWVKIGGHDPVEVIRGLGARAIAVHGKDFDPSATPRWVPAGTGVMPMEEVVKTAQAGGTQFLAIELDESPADPLDAVAASFAYYKGLGLS